MPHHEREPEQEHTPTGGLAQISVQAFLVQTHILAQCVEWPVAELCHAQDAGAAGRVTVAVPHNPRVIHDHHRETVLAKEMLGHLHQHR